MKCNNEQTERQQRIIYSGQLLQDDVKLKDVLRQVCNMQYFMLLDLQIEVWKGF